jgi:hypothetical protein
LVSRVRQCVRALLAHLDADPSAAHLVRHGGSGAGAEEGVEDEVVGVGGNQQQFVQELFRLRRVE